MISFLLTTQAIPYFILFKIQNTMSTCNWILNHLINAKATKRLKKDTAHCHTGKTNELCPNDIGAIIIEVSEMQGYYFKCHC